MSVSQVEMMGNRDLMEWIAYYEIEPFGQYRDNLHAGMVASILYNANRGKRTKALEVSDFILRDRWEQREKQTAEFFGGLRALAKKADK